MNLEAEHQDAYGKTLFCMIYTIYFSRNIQSNLLFECVLHHINWNNSYENMGHISESYQNRNTKETDTYYNAICSSIRAIQDKQ
jgi:hypothetical protein